MVQIVYPRFEAKKRKKITIEIRDREMKRKVDELQNHGINVAASILSDKDANGKPRIYNIIDNLHSML